MMNKKSKEIAFHLIEKFIEMKFNWVEPELGDPYLFVEPEHLVTVVSYLKDSWEFGFDYLVNLSGYDAGTHIEMTYHLFSYRHRHKVILKVKVVRLNGTVASLTPLYGTANFQEREVFDLLGVTFIGHPNLTRIMLPEDWEGHPLLKDYQEKESCQGIATTRPGNF